MTLRRRSRLGIFTALTATMGIAVALGLPGVAAAFADPPGNVWCNDPSVRTVTVYPNNSLTSWYGGSETVYFRSNLYRYNGSNWVLYDGSAPWLRAVANDLGVLPWHSGAATYHWVDSRTNQILEHWTFSVGSGYYRVVDYYDWPSSGRTLSVTAGTYFGSGATGSYCTIY